MTKVTPISTEIDCAAFELPDLPPPSAFLGHQTARSAVQHLIGLDEGYHEPTRAERDALLMGFAKARMPLYGAAFDVLRLKRFVDLTDPDDIFRNLDEILICEVKSSNRTSLRSDFGGYFFNITAGEMLTAQALGKRYRFLFVNTVTQTHVERSLQEVFAAAKAMYPAWHIRF